MPDARAEDRERFEAFYADRFGNTAGLRPTHGPDCYEVWLAATAAAQAEIERVTLQRDEAMDAEDTCETICVEAIKALPGGFKVDTSHSLADRVGELAHWGQCWQDAARKRANELREVQSAPRAPERETADTLRAERDDYRARWVAACKSMAALERIKTPQPAPPPPHAAARERVVEAAMAWSKVPRYGGEPLGIDAAEQSKPLSMALSNACAALHALDQPKAVASALERAITILEGLTVDASVPMLVDDEIQEALGLLAQARSEAKA